MTIAPRPRLAAIGVVLLTALVGCGGAAAPSTATLLQPLTPVVDATSRSALELERVAVGGGERVRAGDILGYVGDSGNAASVGPHLRFGIYKRGSEPIDPLPLLEERRFAGPPSAAFERVERTAAPPPKCSARFPDSMSTERVCLAFETPERPPVQVAPPRALIVAVTMPMELAPRSMVLPRESTNDAPALSCSSAAAGLPGVCSAQARRGMTF